MRLLAVIPARGGSKGVPRKNAKLLRGKPLLAYTCEAARGARLNRVVLTTDDAELAEIGRRFGVEVPFMRSPELARDDTPMLPVLQDAVQRIEQSGDRFDAICLLQPTNPMRTSETIDRCIERLEASDADAVVTLLKVPHEFNPHWVYFTDAQGHLALSTGEAAPIPRRQALPPAFHREGSVYLVRRDVLMNDGSLYGSKLVGVELDRDQSVNIDGTADWERAERLIAERAVRP